MSSRTLIGGDIRVAGCIRPSSVFNSAPDSLGLTPPYNEPVQTTQGGVAVYPVRALFQLAPVCTMSETELAVGESMIVSDEGDALTVETTRTEEHLFTTTYTDADTGELRLALQVDITTGSTALDPRHIDADFWTLIQDGDAHPMSDLKRVLRRVPDPSIEVKPDRREIHVYEEE